jgi:hypothetical protein
MKKMLLLLGCAALLAGSDCDDAEPKAEPTAVADAGTAAPAPVADAGKATPVPKVEVGEATVTDAKAPKDKKPKDKKPKK